MKNVFLFIVLGLFTVGCEIAAEIGPNGAAECSPGNYMHCEAQWSCEGDDGFDNYDLEFITEIECLSYCVEAEDCVCFGEFCDLQHIVTN